MIRHHNALYKDLADPIKLLERHGANSHLQRYWGYANADDSRDLTPDDVTGYTKLMATSQQSVSEQVIAAIDLGNSQHLLDVGGGNAAFAIAVAKKWPHLRVTVADLPAVTGEAQQNISASGLHERIDTVAVDFKRQPLPAGHDAVSLVRIMHDHDDADAQQLLAAAAVSLPPAGRIIVAEPMAEKSVAGKLLQTYFSMYLLAMGQGRLRHPDELRQMLEQAGFRSIRRASTPIPLISSVLVGYRSQKT